MIIKLVVDKADGMTCGHTVELQHAETVVGRHRDCGLRIPSPDVSRRHCILRIFEDLLSIEDLGSMNGSYLNGERVVGLQNVKDGDRLEIGPVMYKVQYCKPATHVTQVVPDTVKVSNTRVTITEDSKTAQVKADSPTLEHVVR